MSSSILPLLLLQKVLHPIPTSAVWSNAYTKVGFSKKKYGQRMIFSSIP
jgi:hypothetical protein